LRCVPDGFNWVDHRLVSQHFITRCDHVPWLFFVFGHRLRCPGLSYYSDAAIGRRLKMDFCNWRQLQQLVGAISSLIKSRSIRCWAGSSSSTGQDGGPATFGAGTIVASSWPAAEQGEAK